MKIKKIILILILSLITITNVHAINFKLNSDKVIIVNTTDNMVLYEKNADIKTSIASLTKIVTAITIIENTEDLTEVVTITKDMLKGLNGYAKLGLRVGNKITVEELLYALMLPSTGDSAQALAINKSGTISEFVKLMNDEVKKIGVSNTHFTNPVGKDAKENYSTARDLYVILEYSLKNPAFKKIYEANEYYIKSIDKKVQKSLKRIASEYNIDISMIKGAKTGWTTDAGMCLSTTASINGTQFIAIVLNAKEYSLNHITDTVNLYTYYKNNYSYKAIINIGDLLYTLDIKDSKEKKYNILADEEVKFYLKNTVTKNDYKIIFDGVEFIKRKTKKGDFLGKINLVYNGDIVYTTDVYLQKDIKFYNYELYGIVVVSAIVLLLLIIICIKRKKDR